MTRRTVCWTLPAAFTIAVALTSGGPRTQADDSAAGAASESRQAGFQVALVDVARIFKDHRGFKKKLEQMKKDLADAQGRIELESAQIKVYDDRLKTLDVQSQEYLELEEKINTRRSSLQTQVAREKRQFIQQEAAIYAQTYAEVQRAVEQYARAHGIRFVMRFHSEPIDESDSKSVMQGVNRNVLFQDGLDITAEVVQRLNAKDVEPRGE